MASIKTIIRPKSDNMIKISPMILNALKGEESALIDAVIMTSQELVDNAAEHGFFESGVGQAKYELHIDDEKVSISITNYVSSKEVITAVRQKVKAIAEKAPGYNKGGLYRITANNKFSLSCKSKDTILAITAEKKIKGASAAAQQKSTPQSTPKRTPKTVSRSTTPAPASTPASTPGTGAPEELVDHELHIKVEKKGQKVTLKWTGKSSTRNPEKSLSPYFEKVIPTLKGCELTVDFCELKFMNSSTVPPIVTFATSLEKNSVKTVFYYNQSLDWQVASFNAFRVIVHKMKYVSLEGR
ncbi:MAG: hypothetical protein GY754_31670 [bacterium]|nr:hypothetical protein [bacterium]